MASPPVKVFISHAEHDKDTIAIPLYRELRSCGIRAFVDDLHLNVGDEETDVVDDTMEEADIAVIVLSPEYIAYKQPMKELLCFLRRRDGNARVPVIVPFFYRLTKTELHDEPRLDRFGSDGKSLYGTTAFLERYANGEPEADIKMIKIALRKVVKLRGLENIVDATNDNIPGMSVRRQILVEQLCTKLKRIVPGEETVSAAPTTPTQTGHDAFCPYFEEKPDVPELVLDFDPRDGGELTREGELLELVLDKPGGPKGRSIAIRGIPGVGKTCMLKGLLGLDRVHKRFKDGVYVMSLGKDATSRKVIEALASFVERSGGYRRAKNILENKVKEAVMHFRSWFSMKDCLFVVDDVWESKELSSSLIHDIVTLSRNGKEGKVLLTTRDRSIASRADIPFILEPKEPLEAQARAILSRYSCIPIYMRSGSTLHRNAVTKILTECCGLPFFLAIAGRAVRSLSLLPGPGTGRGYEVYASSLSANMESFVNTDVDSYERLQGALTVSLKLLEERMRCLGFDVPLKAGEMHRRLSVLERQAKVPMTMLQYLWELDSSAETEIVAREFEQLAMVGIETEEVDGGIRQLLRLHDSLHLFAVTEARKRKGTDTAHAALVQGYGADLKVIRGFVMWWSPKLKPDGYIHDNLCRHLLGSGQYAEILHLLFNPEWIARMFSVSGIAQIEHDFSVCIAALESQRKRSKRSTRSSKGGVPDKDSISVKRETIKAMELLSVAISAAAKYIADNFQEFSFQLCGRLVGYYARFNEIREFLDLLERNTKGPWIKSISCVLQHPSPSSKRVSALEVPVVCMVIMSAGERVACGCEDGSIIIVDVAKRGAKERAWKAHNTRIGCLAIDGNGTILVSASIDYKVNVWDATSLQCLRTISALDIFSTISLPMVYCLAVLGDGKHIFAGFDNGCCLVWSAETGQIVLQPYRAHDTSVQCVTVLNGGKHVVTAANDGFLRCWNGMTGEKLGEDFYGHAESIESVILSPDRTTIVSGSIDGTARIWDLGNHEQLGEAFRPPRKVWIRRVAMSSDGRKLAATCGVNRQVIRVWDIETRQELCHPLSDHESEITGISFLPGDESLVTCSKDKTVRFWEVEAESDEIFDEKHSDIVKRVCFTPDGSHVVSASNDGYLRVWNCASGIQVGKPVEIIFKPILDIAVTRDGSSIVSLSNNSMVQTWDFKTRKLKSEFKWSERKQIFDGLEKLRDDDGSEHRMASVLESLSATGDSISLGETAGSSLLDDSEEEQDHDVSTRVIDDSVSSSQHGRSSTSSLRFGETFSFRDMMKEIQRYGSEQSSTGSAAQALSSRWSQFGGVFRRRPVGSSRMTATIEEPHDPFSDNSPPETIGRFVKKMESRDMKVPASEYAYLSEDGRRLIQADVDIRVYDLSTKKLVKLKHMKDGRNAAKSKKEILAGAGEPTTGMPDFLSIREGNRHVRLADVGLAATFEAPVWHSAWAGKEDLFCVGLENGRVGIMKVMNKPGGDG